MSYDRRPDQLSLNRMLSSSVRSAAVIVLVVLSACASGGGLASDAGTSSDAVASRDANLADAALDTSLVDAPSDAARPVDATMDASAVDAGAPDAGPLDAGAADLGLVDLGPPDAAVVCDPCGVCDTNATNDCFMCAGANTDDVVVGGSTTGGPNLYLAIRFAATGTMKVVRAEMFTGERSSDNTLSLWTDNATGPEPLAMSATATFGLAMTNAWQGANFPSLTEYSSGSFGWLIWQPVVGQQSSTAPSGTSVTYRGAFGGPTGWNGPFMGFIKYKLYCAPSV